MSVDFTTPLGQRLVEARGVVETGQIANMRTYRLPRRPAIHVRIVGESRTLCGRSLRNNDQWAWQFINRGQYPDRMPAHMTDDDACRACLRSPVAQRMLQVRAAAAAATRAIGITEDGLAALTKHVQRRRTWATHSTST